jgi:probable selenium-dependent hydroxylase accessory protein YqeC
VVGLSALGQPLSEKWVFRAKRFAELTGHCAGRPIDAAAVAAIIRHPEGLMKGCPKDAVRIAFLNQADSSDRIAAGRRIADLLAHGQSDVLSLVVIGKCHSDPPVIDAINF